MKEFKRRWYFAKCEFYLGMMKLIIFFEEMDYIKRKHDIFYSLARTFKKYMERYDKTWYKFQQMSTEFENEEMTIV